MNPLKIGKTLLIATSLLILSGCSQIAFSTATDDEFKVAQFTGKTDRIHDIQNQANQGKTVVLKGKVGKQVPLLGGMVYELQDNTGTIWVLSQPPLPKPGEEVVVKGKVRYQSIRINNQDQGSVYIEQDQG